MAKILVIAEHSSIREFISEELAGEGHLVVTIGNPALIGELLSTLEPDLVLLDFHRSRMNLWRVLGEIKRRDAHLPVFSFTSYGRYKGKIRFKVMNGSGVKSIPPEILKQEVAEVVGREPVHDFDRMKGHLLSH